MGGAEPAAGLVDHLLLGVRAAASERVRLQVLVEEFGRVELGAVAG